MSIYNHWPGVSSFIWALRLACILLHCSVRSDTWQLLRVKLQVRVCLYMRFMFPRIYFSSVHSSWRCKTQCIRNKVCLLLAVFICLILFTLIGVLQKSGRRRYWRRCACTVPSWTPTCCASSGRASWTLTAFVLSRVRSPNRSFLVLSHPRVCC